MREEKGKRKDEKIKRGNHDPETNDHVWIKSS